MARQIVVEITGNSKGFQTATEEATKQSQKFGGVMSGLAAGMGLGMFSSAQSGLGAVFEAGKSIIEISEKQESASKSLEQAWTGSVKGLKEYRSQIDTFINSNTRFIKTQSDVTEGFATFTREGLDTQKATRDMNIALDLSALKHVSLSDAVHMVAGAEQGRMKPLIDLGINTKAMNAANRDSAQELLALHQAETKVTTTEQTLAMAKQSLRLMEEGLAGKTKLTVLEQDKLSIAHQKVKDATDKHTAAVADLNTVQTEQKDKIDVVNTAMDELSTKTKGGRDSTSDMEQATNNLDNKWQHLAGETGPGLTKLLTDMVTDASNLYDGLDKFGKNDSWWKGLNDGIIKIDQAELGLIKDFQTFTSLGTNQIKPGSIPGAIENFLAPLDPRTYSKRAAGGSVRAGTPYVVGEKQPELFVPDTSGTILPSVPTSNGEIADLLREISAKLDAPTGQTGVAADLYKAMQGSALNRSRGMAGA